MINEITYVRENIRKSTLLLKFSTLVITDNTHKISFKSKIPEHLTVKFAD